MTCEKKGNQEMHLHIRQIYLQQQFVDLDRQDQNHHEEDSSPAFVSTPTSEAATNKLKSISQVIASNERFWRMRIEEKLRATSPGSVCAMIAVNGSSLFNRSSSFGITASFNGQSRSPLWCPKFPHLRHFTLRNSTPNGFALPAIPVSSLAQFQSN